MAAKKETNELEAVESSKEGMRIKLSKDASEWLDKMCSLTGMDKGEFIEASLNVMKEKGREMLAQAIIAKAKAVSDALLSDS